MESFFGNRGWGGWGWWSHPQYTPAQQAARRAVETAKQELHSAIELWARQVESAGLNGQSCPAAPDLSKPFADLTAAEKQLKAADQPATPTTTTPTTTGK